MALSPAAVCAAGIAAPAASRLNEEKFRFFYEGTARPLRAYIRKMLGDAEKADDLLQESYLRLLEARLSSEMTEEHRKNYLFRIATNLSRDELSRRKTEPLSEYASTQEVAHRAAERRDMEHFLAQLPAGQREILWLAYVERFSHKEIAAAVGAKTASIRPMLARARAKLSEMLKSGGF